jgi:cyclic pyranopterin monophosphate synthase
MTRQLTHIDEQGRAAMVNVGSKEPMRRTAVAEGFFLAGRETLDQIEARQLPKGEALAVARIAGIQAAKRCDELIPLCHSLPLDSVSVSFERAENHRLRIVATASTVAKTGVEMEALTAVSIAALALYDMAKSVDRDLAIADIRLIEKTKADV